MHAALPNGHILLDATVKQQLGAPQQQSLIGSERTGDQD